MIWASMENITSLRATNPSESNNLQIFHVKKKKIQKLETRADDGTRMQRLLRPVERVISGPGTMAIPQRDVRVGACASKEIIDLPQTSP